MSSFLPPQNPRIFPPMLKTHILKMGGGCSPLDSHVASQDDEVSPWNLWIFLFHRPEQLASLPKVGIVVPTQLGLKPLRFSSFRLKVAGTWSGLHLHPLSHPIPWILCKLKWNRILGSKFLGELKFLSPVWAGHVPCKTHKERSIVTIVSWEMFDFIKIQIIIKSHQARKTGCPPSLWADPSRRPGSPHWPQTTQRLLEVLTREAETKFARLLTFRLSWHFVNRSLNGRVMIQL